MGLPKVFVTRQIPTPGLDLLCASAEIDLWPNQLPPPRDVLLKRVRGCAGLLTLLSDRIDDEVLASAGPQLKVVSNYAVGYNNIEVKAAAARGIRVGNTPGVLTDATADLAVARPLDASRWVTASANSIHRDEWKTWEPLGFLGQELKGKTLGIVGLGRIGFATAQRLCRGWEMNLVYSGRSNNVEAERELAAERVSFDELLARSDFISVHCALTPETTHLFNRQAFERMKPTAVFINTARGGVVVQEDLYEALRGGTIFAAGLDVTDPEPLPIEHPLLTLPNCVVTPHIASATTTARFAMAKIAANNLLAGMAGQEMPHEVRA